ncbi:hypothetical protein DEA06_14455 [Microbacterium sp. Gd 4-13]|uniref:hypothetical protein n=1 Tax=Microbacterium sp. Gd 4-13 TaxID=2173179 RepID=UPI000D579FF1|nr:hypothetical protein [Microbacterium sp. Gd 4-13]PVW02971.1 hypothetical protein DEA06_14455 [Microbacterium sp. Gd 4-13]
MNTSRALRCSVIAFGAVLLVSAGTAAASAAEYGDQNVDVNVEITAIEEPGVLAMTVGPGPTDLVENGSTELVRQFTGTLPTVTVTDTRGPDEIADGAAWYVMGSASDFVDTEAVTTIDAENLGWAPAALGDAEGDPAISIGGDVEPAAAGGPGLVDQELLYLGDSEATAGGAWSATADLKLQVPADVEPGSYKSVLTLSLFE